MKVWHRGAWARLKRRCLDDASSVWRCIQMLGGSQREIVVLSFWRGLTHEQIAEATGRPLGTVKVG